MLIIAHSDGRHQFTVEGPARHPFVVDATHDGPPIGPRPQELLLESLATCLGVTALAVLEKKRLPVAGLIVHVDGTKNTERPGDFVSFKVHIESAGGSELTEAQLARTAELADKNCPVSRTLAKGVPLEVTSAVLTQDQLLARLAAAAGEHAELNQQVAALADHLAQGRRDAALGAIDALAQAFARVGRDLPLHSAAGDLTLLRGLLNLTAPA
jgi:uncharacterized OsmC-like protein